MYLYRLLLFLLIAAASGNLIAQDVEFTVNAKQTVTVGERFRIVYQVNGDGQNFRAPAFGKLQILSGPSTSTSSNVQIINGQMQQSYTKSFTYVVVANQEGEISVTPATITIDGKQYKSNSLKIKVSKGGSSQQNSSDNRKQNQRDQGILQDDDVYLRAFVTKKNPYLGEQIIVTYRIYTRVPISNLSMKKASSFNGFWSKNLMDDQSQLKQSTQVINGEEYIVADISKYAVFPQKSGKLTIEPAELECVAQVRVQQQRSRSNDPFEDFFNDPFFNRNARNVEATLTSKPLTINVKDLPVEGKPADFNGAVGEFTFKSSVDREILVANDALTFSATISGKGNLELINLNQPEFPSDFETYEPKVSNNIKTSSNGISGWKKFEYLSIPRAPGDFTIKPITFSYFDPRQKKYRTYSSGELNIVVEKGNQTASGVTYSSSAQEDIRFIGKDIRHIKNAPFNLVATGSFLFASSIYYILLALPLMLLLLFILLWKRQEKRRGDVTMMKTRKANKVAKKRLQKAEKFKESDEDVAFYDEIAQALWGYIADKFNIQQATLSVETVKDTLSSKGAEEDVIDNFVNTLNNIEFARFAPGDSRGKMATVYKEALNAITQAERALK